MVLLCHKFFIRGVLIRHIKEMNYCAEVASFGWVNILTVILGLMSTVFVFRSILFKILSKQVWWQRLKIGVGHRHLEADCVMLEISQARAPAYHRLDCLLVRRRLACEKRKNFRLTLGSFLSFADYFIISCGGMRFRRNKYGLRIGMIFRHLA